LTVHVLLLTYGKAVNGLWESPKEYSLRHLLRRVAGVGRLVGLVMAVVLSYTPGYAQGISLIRDAEIERDIRLYATPAWQAAGLDPAAVRIFLVNDKTLNAFVAGGQNIFINTGLIIKARNPSEIIGVLAHETGHISAGHLARTQEALKGATATMILSMLAGLGAMVAGAPDAGAALIASGPQFGQRVFLSYSRTQESAADQAALKFLNDTGQSAHGLVDFLELLGDQEALLTTNKDPYVRSHPLTSDRVARLRELAHSSPYWNAPERPGYVVMLKRMQAKLYGFLRPVHQTLLRYPPSDRSIYGRYARAIAYHQDARLDAALAEVNSLVSEWPADPYFEELKGQILFESGKVSRAIEPYRRAVALLPDEPLLRVSLGQAIVALEDKALMPEAIKNLEVSLRKDPQNSFAWHQLAIAYNALGKDGLAAHAAAERYVLAGRMREALAQARQALPKLKKGTPNWWRTQDILVLAESHMDKSGKQARKKPPAKKPDSDGDDH